MSSQSCTESEFREPMIHLSSVDPSLFKVVSNELYNNFVFQPYQARPDTFAYCWGMAGEEFRALVLRICWQKRRDLFARPASPITPETPLRSYTLVQREELEACVHSMLSNAIRVVALLQFVPDFWEGLREGVRDKSRDQGESIEAAQELPPMLRKQAS